jgi:hypothetical protein
MKRFLFCLCVATVFGATAFGYCAAPTQFQIVGTDESAGVQGGVCYKKSQNKEKKCSNYCLFGSGSVYFYLIAGPNGDYAGTYGKTVYCECDTTQFGTYNVAEETACTSTVTVVPVPVPVP